jgi:predicted esterase
MQEHHITVARTARYVTLGTVHEGVTEVWIVCHGYGQLARRFMRHFTPIESMHRLILAPEALSRFYVDAPSVTRHAEAKVGASWMTREDRLSEINDYVNYLDTLYAQLFAQLDRARTRVIVLGFSQGVATVVRWLLQGRATADRIVAWAGLLPTDIDLDAARELFERSPLTVVRGLRDPFADPAVIDEQRARLQRHGIAYERLQFDGGHEVDGELLRMVSGDAAAPPPNESTERTAGQP